MDKLRRTCTTTLALGLLVAPPLLLAGHDNADGPFSKLDPPIPTDAAGKVEVIEESLVRAHELCAMFEKIP